MNNAPVAHYKKSKSKLKEFKQFILLFDHQHVDIFTKITMTMTKQKMMEEDNDFSDHKFQYFCEN